MSVLEGMESVEAKMAREFNRREEEEAPQEVSKTKKTSLRVALPPYLLAECHKYADAMALPVNTALMLLIDKGLEVAEEELIAKRNRKNRLNNSVRGY